MTDVAAATTVSKQFYGGDIDGILGMAYPAISNSGEKTIFQSLHEQGLVKGNLFSFQLGDNEEGELYLGGTDSSRFEGEINYTPVTQPACESSSLALRALEAMLMREISRRLDNSRQYRS